MCKLFKYYNEKFEKIHNNMIETLGLYTVNVLLQRVKWNISERYHQARFIKVENDIIFFNDLFEKCEDGIAEDIYQAFILDIFIILKKLVGEEISRDIIGDEGGQKLR